MGITDNVLTERYGLQTKKWCQTLTVERNRVCSSSGLNSPVCIDFVRDEICSRSHVTNLRINTYIRNGSSSFGNVLLG